MKRNVFAIVGTLALLLFGYYVIVPRFLHQSTSQTASSSLEEITLSGTYTCLPLLDKTKVREGECVFGMRTEDGEYYMVNFGASASAMAEFQNRAHITAKGFVNLKETLNTDQWAPYDMKGVFTITE